MRPSTGRWVSGDDFFDRKGELEVLQRRARDRNHVLLSGQRRMGKTSLLRELGRLLENQGWTFLFADVEGAACPEDAIAGIAEAVHPIRSMAARLAEDMKRWVGENVEEISASEFGVRLRGGLNSGNWRRHGERLFRHCAEHDKPVLLVVDELPIFLKRMLNRDGDPGRVDEFLSWLRGALQIPGEDSPVLIVSGSIGLEPLVRRLGIPDRINYLYPIRLGPWDRATSIACFERLADSDGLPVAAGVAEAVYDALGIGIPHHVQSFFARLSDFAAMEEREGITVADVDRVYRTALLGPPGQNDLVHYETRLKEALDDESHSLAMEILAEAALQETFTPNARHRLEALYSKVMEGAPHRIADTLDVLVHDGYLEPGGDGHRFPSRLLRDWWATRFHDHRVPLDRRPAGDAKGGAAQ